MIAGRTNDAGEPCGFGGCRFNRPEDRSDSFTNLAPKFSLGFDQGNNHWFFRAARGFRAPQATELYRLQNGQSVSNIDSESIDSVELVYACDDSHNAASSPLRYAKRRVHLS